VKLFSSLKGFGTDLLGMVKRRPIWFALFLLIVGVFVSPFILIGYRAIRGAIAKVPGIGTKVADALPAR
jgi:hypothetical protein